MLEFRGVCILLLVLVVDEFANAIDIGKGGDDDGFCDGDRDRDRGRKD